jgi:hypothetical protein
LVSAKRRNEINTAGLALAHRRQGEYKAEREALKAAIEQVREVCDSMTYTPLGPPGTNDLFTVGRYEMCDRVRGVLPAALDAPETTGDAETEDHS